MTDEKFESELKLINDERDRKIKDLNIKYVQENSPFKIGDIVTDHIGSLRVERIGTQMRSHKTPEAVYFGVELKKDGTPTKRQSRYKVYQSNIIYDVDAF